MEADSNMFKAWSMPGPSISHYDKPRSHENRVHLTRGNHQGIPMLLSVAAVSPRENCFVHTLRPHSGLTWMLTHSMVLNFASSALWSLMIDELWRWLMMIDDDLSYDDKPQPGLVHHAWLLQAGHFFTRARQQSRPMRTNSRATDYFIGALGHQHITKMAIGWEKHPEKPEKKTAKLDFSMTWATKMRWCDPVWPKKTWERIQS